MRFATRVLAVLVGTAVGLLAVEGLLRLIPSVISEAALVEFPDSLRTTIAMRLDLPTEKESIVISSAQRVDGGPPIDLLPLNTFVRDPVDRVDRQVGASSGIRTDKNGFCNPPHKAERVSADVVVIGDSFTFCLGVMTEQTATAQIEAMTGLSTYNFGVEQVGPYEYIEINKIRRRA